MMRLKLTRTELLSDRSLGQLYIDGEYFCDTLEDTDRGLRQTHGPSYISTHKIPGLTAIPVGVYQITLDEVSPRFSQSDTYKFCNGKLPRLLSVPGFDGVLIHVGNYPKDTAGCILVGVREGDHLVKSRDTFRRLYDILLKAKGTIVIEITNV